MKSSQSNFALLVAAAAAALVGVAAAAAFVRPELPRQANHAHAVIDPLPVGLSPASRNGASTPSGHRPASAPPAFVDPSLDNPLIEEDAAIHPARKCAVCIG